jgi:large subunit ribosomal protein L10
VAKKTLFGLAFKDKAIAGWDIKKFVGQVAAVFGYGDEVSPAKIVGEFKSEKEKEGKIEFIGGILENKFLSAAEVDSLSKLPSKKELYAKIVGSINAPVSGFVNALAGNIRNLVQVLKAVSEKK